MNRTTIEWTDYTWNSVTGCDKVSAGCRSCYAETMAKRFWGERKFTDVQMHPERLYEVLYMSRKLDGKKVFVCDVSDLFHDKVTDYFIYDIIEIIHNYPDTVFQILTKRPERAVTIFQGLGTARAIEIPKNIWLGVSCEDQEQANKRIPLLLQIPAAVRFLSCEPLIGPIEFVGRCSLVVDREQPTTNNEQRIHWVIAGGESGHMARPMHPDWVRSLRDQCKAANVPFFFKQWGEYAPYEFDRETTEPIRSKPEHHTFWKDKTGQRFELVDYDGEYLVAGLYDGSGHAAMQKLGKSKSGNMLDGRTHLEFPKTVHSGQSTVDRGQSTTH